MFVYLNVIICFLPLIAYAYLNYKSGKESNKNLNGVTQ